MANPTYAELKAQLAAKELEMAALRDAAKIARASRPVEFRLTDAGKISIYGLGQRFPVTLGHGQVETLKTALNSDVYAKFVADNAGKMQERLPDGTFGIPAVATA